MTDSTDGEHAAINGTGGITEVETRDGKVDLTFRSPTGELLFCIHLRPLDALALSNALYIGWKDVRSNAL